MLSKTLIENVTDAILIVDDQMRVVEINDVACEYLLAERKDLIGRRPNEFVIEPGRERIEGFWERLQGRGIIKGHIPAKGEAGQMLNIEYQAFANIEPNRHLIIFKEVSVQKRVEAQTQAFLKLGRQLSASGTSQSLARIIVEVADDLLTWDACIVQLYFEETGLIEPLLVMDLVNGTRQEILPNDITPPAPLIRRAIFEGKFLLEIQAGSDDPDHVVFGDVGFENVTVMFVPIRDGNKVIGVLSVQKYMPAFYTNEDLDTLQALADYVGGAFHRIQGEALLTRSKNRLEVLREIEQAILEIRSPEEIAEVALSRIKKIIEFNRGSVILFDYLIGKGRLLAETGVVSKGRDGEETGIEFLFGELLKELGNNNYLLLSDLSNHIQQPSSRMLADLVESGMRAVIFVPLIAGNTLFGVLNLASTRKAAFRTEDAEVAAEVAASLAVALQNATLLLGAKEQADRLSALVDETRRRAEQMEVMVNISSALRQTQSRQALIPIILNRLMALSKAAGAAIAMRSGEDRLVFELSLGQWPQLAETSFPIDEGITGQVLNSGKVFVADDLSTEPEFTGLRIFPEVYAAICVPMGVDENSLGVLWLVRNQPFSEDEQRVMVAVADIVANAVRRAVLYERLQEQARQVQQIVDTIPEGMLLLNEERDIVLANPVAQTYLAQLADASIGDKLTHLSGRPLDELLKPVVAGENWHELEFEPTGQIFELAVQQTYGRLAGGFVLVIRDVTEDRNQARYFQIQERLAVVGQLAAGIAHDFNNIMSVIILYSTMLGQNENFSGKEKERLVVIHRQAERASELIRQILDFSRQSVMKRSALNLRPFLKELVKLLKRTLPETINLKLEMDPGDLIIQGDSTRLQQAIMNLAVNARDAMPTGGTLLISLKVKQVKPDDLPPLPDMEPGIWFELQVQDTGTGIRQHHLPHLFEPFFTTKREGEGTGLGLAQVYGIVKQHNGYIDVTSRLKRGTTFFIYLPGEEVLKHEDANPEVFPISEGKGQTILVVEDDSSAREALSEVLLMMNYNVETASNGLEALDQFDRLQGSIDLVLSDVVMPKMGGAALFTQLKKRQPDIKMVVMSGYPQKDKEWPVLNDPAIFWVQKPFQVSKMVETIKDALKA